MYDYFYCFYHEFVFTNITLINNHEQYLFYTKHIYQYVHNITIYCSKMLIYERVVVT